VDAMLELEIFTRAQAIRGVLTEWSVELDEETGVPLEPIPEKVPEELRDEVKNRIGKLFGRNEETDPKNPLLKPQQAKFIENFFSNQENWGMAFRTGIGKTRTFLEISSRWLEQNPQKMVLISIPVGNLVNQILAEIESFESISHLSRMVVQDHDKLKYPMLENVDMLERLAIITAHQSDEEFRAKVKEFIGRLRNNLVIATPQKIERMLASGKIQP
jgi:hypothetical protein